MSNDKTSKDFELEDLEKPLTEQEMKETTGGEGIFAAGQFGKMPDFTKPPEIHIPVNPAPRPTNPFASGTPTTLKTSDPIPTLMLPTPSKGSGTIPSFVPKELRDKLGNK
ncbi:hypothetical protein [Paenibacillus sp. MBLB4367]|uniref:hypothetical protein n=1 Tax=Paenibacillus sp. MBLB4367 TaxID=3384767 RepID=UPI00390836B5